MTDKYYKSINSDSYIVKKESVPSNPGKVHLVKPGESLWEISRMYNGLTIEKIKKLNNLSGNKIMPGQKLRISWFDYIPEDHYDILHQIFLLLLRYIS